MVASSHISIPPRYSACIANSIDLSLVYIITLVIAMHPPLEGVPDAFGWNGMTTVQMAHGCEIWALVTYLGIIDSCRHMISVGKYVRLTFVNACISSIYSQPGH